MWPWALGLRFLLQHDKEGSILTFWCSCGVLVCTWDHSCVHAPINRCTRWWEYVFYLGVQKLFKPSNAGGFNIGGMKETKAVLLSPWTDQSSCLAIFLVQWTSARELRHSRCPVRGLLPVLIIAQTIILEKGPPLGLPAVWLWVCGCSKDLSQRPWNTEDRNQCISTRALPCWPRRLCLEPASFHVASRLGHSRGQHFPPQILPAPQAWELATPIRKIEGPSDAGSLQKEALSPHCFGRCCPSGIVDAMGWTRPVEALRRSSWAFSSKCFTNKGKLILGN